MFELPSHVINFNCGNEPTESDGIASPIVFKLDIVETQLKLREVHQSDNIRPAIDLIKKLAKSQTIDLSDSQAYQVIETVVAAFNNLKKKVTVSLESHFGTDSTPTP